MPHTDFSDREFLNVRIRKGELVLYVSRRSLSRNAHAGELPNPVLGVYKELGLDDYDRPESRFYPYPLILMPRTVGFEGEQRPSVSRGALGNCMVITNAQFAELRVGKDRVLDYISSRADLSMHKDWISKLERPYAQSMPSPRAVLFI